VTISFRQRNDPMRASSADDNRAGNQKAENIYGNFRMALMPMLPAWSLHICNMVTHIKIW